MDKQENHFVEIPQEFHSFENEGLFTNCIECDRELLDGSCDYVIEKAVRNYQGFKAEDVIFDYAICMKCAMEVQQNLSKESMRSIQQYMEENMQIEARAKQMQFMNADYSGFVDECLISNRPKNSCDEYQVFAYCRGDKMNLQMPPYMISGQILDEISELLSDETRDELNGFFNKHFSPAPGMFEPDPRLILI
ncbi:MAG: hypothetical protein RIC35_03675 [Marinoscillum sp.]